MTDLTPVDHPLVTLARVAHAWDCEGLEVRHRLAGDGINVRLWCTTALGAEAIRDAAERLGFSVPLCDRHVHNGNYDGWQILIVVMATDAASLARAIGEAASVLAVRELTAGEP